MMQSHFSDWEGLQVHPTHFNLFQAIALFQDYARPRKQYRQTGILKQANGGQHDVYACMKIVSLLSPGCWEAWPNIGWLSFTAAIIKQANGGQHDVCACMKTVSLLSPGCWEA